MRDVFQPLGTDINTIKIGANANVVGAHQTHDMLNVVYHSFVRGPGKLVKGFSACLKRSLWAMGS